ncbi:amino acid transporter family protein [Pelomyxa schiedti]|nr:amino acid transporter family protein [Pelomyxa schiedti]
MSATASSPKGAATTARALWISDILWRIVLPHACPKCFTVLEYRRLLHAYDNAAPSLPTGVPANGARGGGSGAGAGAGGAGLPRPRPPPPPPGAPRAEDVGEEVVVLGRAGEAVFPLAGLCSRLVARCLATWRPVFLHVLQHQCQSSGDAVGKQSSGDAAGKYSGRDMSQLGSGEEMAITVFSALGYLKMVSWTSTNLITPCDSWDKSFIEAVALAEAIRNGKTHVMQYLMAHIGIHPLVLAERRDFFLHSCFRGDTSVCEWLVDSCGLNSADARALNNKAFRICCGRGHLHTAQWLATQLSLTPNEIRSADNSAFRKSCRGGYLELAQWLQSKFSLTVDDATTTARDTPNYALYHSCSEGHFHVVQWLVETFHLSTSPECYTAALLGCSLGGHIKIAKWLMATFSNESVTTSCFKNACSKGHLEMAKWLCQKVPVAPTDDVSEIMFNACSLNHSEVMVWLGETFTVPPDSNWVLECIYEAYSHGNLPILKWLASKFSLGSHTELDQNFYVYGYCRSITNVELFKWFLDHFSVAPDSEIGLLPHLPILQYAVKTMPLSHNILCRGLWTLLQTGALDCVQWLISQVEFTQEEIYLSRGEEEPPHITHWKATTYPPTPEFFPTVFICACKSENLKLATWLIEHWNSLKKNSKQAAALPATLTKAFLACCQCGSADACHWLFEKFGAGILPKKPAQNSAFRTCCEHGHLRLAQFICEKYSISRIWAAEEDWCVFRKTCFNSHLHVAMWLVEKFSITTDDIVNAKNFFVKKSLRPQNHNILLCNAVTVLVVCESVQRVMQFVSCGVYGGRDGCRGIMGAGVQDVVPTIVVEDSPHGAIMVDPKLVHSGTPFTATVSMVNTMLGAGMVALPFAVKIAGILPFTVMMLFCGLLNWITLVMLVSCSLVIIMQTLLICTVLSIFIGDWLSELLGQVALPQHWTFIRNKQLLSIIISVCIFIPLSMKSRLSSLKVFSFIAMIAAVCAAVGVVFVFLVETKGTVASGTKLGGAGWNSFQSVPIIFVAFVAHYNVLSVYQELEPRSVKRFSAVCASSVLIMLILYMLFALSGYLMFGAATSDDIFENFTGNNVVITAARVAMCGTVCLTFPTKMFALRSCINSLRKAELSEARKNIETVVLVSLCVGIGILFPSIHYLLDLTGSTAVILISLIIPASLFLALQVKVTTQGKLLATLATVILLVGVFFSVTRLSIFWFAQDLSPA